MSWGGISMQTGARQLFDGLPDPTVVVGQQDQVVAWSRAAERVFGIPAHDAEGRLLSQLLHFNEPRWRQPAVSAALEGAPWRGRVVLAVGAATMWVDWSIVQAPEAIGATIETLRDVSERVRGERLLETLFDESPYVLALIDADTNRYLRVSRLFCEHQRRSAEQIVGRTSAELGMVPTESAGALSDKLFRQGYLDNEQVTSAGADGSLRTGLVSTRLLNLEGKRLALNIWIDITELKTTEAELRESKQRFDEAMEAISAVLWQVEFDSHGEVHDTYISPQAEAIMGIPPGTLNHDWARYIACVHPDDRPGIDAAIREAIVAPGRKVDVEYRILRGDGSLRWMRSTGRARSAANGGARAYGITEDMTAHRQADEERERLAEQLRQAQKMESIGRLAGGVAHDFNNILTAIQGNIDLVLLEMAPGDRRVARLKDAQSATARAAELTRHLLAFSRRRIIEPHVLDLNELVRNSARLLERLLGEDIQVETTLKDNLWSVRVDPSQFEQILINLAVNSRDAMPHGGILTIETAHVVLDAAYCVRHPEATPGPYVMLAVSDTGCGMTPEVKASLFEPFFTTKPLGQGTGLGLAMVHGLVRQHGGTIEVYSEVSEGTTFKVYLPAVNERSQSIPMRAEPAAEGGRETILLVEDDSGVRKLAVEVLSQLGYRVLESVSAAQAIAAGADNNIDLLVTDVVLPDHNGRWLADQLRARLASLKVLYTSGYTANVIVHHGVLEQGINFLEKPYSARALGLAVRRGLDGLSP